MGKSIAFLDMEFGHICGTQKLIYYPIDVGVIIYDPQEDEIVETFSKSISRDANIERWSNNTNEIMMTIQPSLVKVENSHQNKYELEYDSNYRVEMEEIPELISLAKSAHDELKTFLLMVNSKHNIQHFFFFGARMDLKCIERSGFQLNESNIIDIQNQVKKLMRMDKRLSLDRACYALNVNLKSNKIVSDNFEYQLPKNKKGKFKNHNAIGDAGRIFLVHKELEKSDKEVKSKIRDYFKICRDYNNRENIQ